MHRTPEEIYLHETIESYVKPLRTEISELRKELTPITTQIPVIDTALEKGVSIIIAGSVATGKSTVMYDLYQLMMKEGYSVVMNFEGHPEHDTKESFVAEMESNRKERLDAIKKSTMITLKEMQLKREAHKNINYETKG